MHICDVFDALRTKRPYRDAWPEEKVLTYLSEGAGAEFDPDLTRAFVRMIRTWSHRLAYLERPDAPLQPQDASTTNGSGGSDAPGDVRVEAPDAAASKDDAGSPSGEPGGTGAAGDDPDSQPGATDGS